MNINAPKLGLLILMVILFATPIPAHAQVDQGKIFSNWEKIPREFSGFYSRDCSKQNNNLVFTGFGRFAYLDGHNTGEYLITAIKIDDAQKLEDQLIIQPGFQGEPDIYQLIDQKLYEGDPERYEKSNVNPYTRCGNLPPSLSMFHGEGINGIIAMDHVLRVCTSNPVSECQNELLKLGDVSGNKKWSVAEIARLLRIATYLEQLNRYDPALKGSEAIKNSLISLPLGPIFIRMVLNSLDYDDDGQLSMDELFQDHAKLGAEPLAMLSQRDKSMSRFQDYKKRISKLFEFFEEIDPETWGDLN